MLTPGELLGVGLTLAAVAAIAVFVSSTRMPLALKRIIYLGLAMRVFGAVARYTVLFGYYGGVGDAVGYYYRGLAYAQRFTRFDFSPFYDSALWFRGNWRGTSFMSFPSGIVLSLIGPSMLGEFIAFSLLAFLGLVGFVVAFKRASPYASAVSYARWVWLFPSLWFWPSSVGKDALILMGLGLLVWGWFGPQGRKNWFLLFAGGFFVTAIRPQVAAVFFLSIVLAQWLSLFGRWTMKRVVQGGLIAGLGTAGIVVAMSLSGIDALSPDSVQGYLEEEAAGAVSDGSSTGRVSIGVTGVPIAILNIIARPFPWEATNVMALASAMEILLFWSLVWYRRKNVVMALRSWRTHPLLRIAIPFSLIYAASLGMVVFNLGIIARQRIFLFPFLFLLLEAVPARGHLQPAPRGRRKPRARRRLTLTPPVVQRR
jgi:hypothetical protein